MEVFNASRLSFIKVSLNLRLFYIQNRFYYIMYQSLNIKKKKTRKYMYATESNLNEQIFYKFKILAMKVILCILLMCVVCVCAHIGPVKE